MYIGREAKCNHNQFSKSKWNECFKVEQSVGAVISWLVVLLHVRSLRKKLNTGQLFNDFVARFAYSCDYMLFKQILSLADTHGDPLHSNLYIIINFP